MSHWGVGSRAMARAWEARDVRGLVHNAQNAHIAQNVRHIIHAIYALYDVSMSMMCYVYV